MGVGDSRTASNTWIPTLTAELNASGWPLYQWTHSADIALGGIGSAWLRSVIDATLLSYSGIPTHVLVNMGVNDADVVAPAAYQADMEYSLDAIHAKFPDAKVYLSRFWSRNRTDAGLNDLNATLSTIQSARAGWCYLADDERVWLKGSDNGVTMTTDGVHYSAAGKTEKIAQARAAMGY